MATMRTTRYLFTLLITVLSMAACQTTKRTPGQQAVSPPPTVTGGGPSVDAGDKCQIFERLFTQEPTLDPQRYNIRTREGLNAITLAAMQDDRFVALFDKPYDQLTQQEQVYYSTRLSGCFHGQKATLQNSPYRGPINMLFDGPQNYRESSARLRAARSQGEELLALTRKVEALPSTEAAFDDLLDAQKRSVGLIKRAPADAAGQFTKAYALAYERIVVARELARVDQLTASAAGPTGLRQLWDLSVELGNFRRQANNPTTAQRLEALQGQVTSQIDKLSAELVDAEAAKYVAIKREPPGELATLANAKAFETAFGTAYGDRATGQPFTGFNTARATYRQELLVKTRPQLLRRIEDARQWRQIKALLDQYVVTSDIESLAAKPIADLLQKRSVELRPFAALPGGNYLDAIYDQDPDEIDRVDQRLSASIQQMSPLGQMLLGLRDSGNSLIGPTITYYLFHYEERYSACLRQGAVRFELTTTTAVTTKNRVGAVMARTYYTNTDHFAVNSEFVEIFRKVGEDQPDRAAAISQLLRNDDLANVLKGLAEMMKRFDCRDAKVQQFEKNLRRVYLDMYRN